MSYINYNGKFLSGEIPIIKAGNRGLRYGDGLFETIRCRNGSPLLIDDHLARLWNGLKLLDFDIPKLFTPDLLEKEIISVLQKNKSTNARIRLSIFRGQGGLYDPENNYPNYLIESFPLEEPSLSLNQNGLQIGIFKDAVKYADKYSNIKHNNFLPYLLGASFAKKNKLNDVIILNQFNNICDSTIANIFLIKGNQISTPSLSEGCIAGVMRNVILRSLKSSEWEIKECPVSIDTILEAEEVFLSNSIRGIRWVFSIDDAHFGNKKTMDVLDWVMKTNPEVFC